jgi:hypothetical protein
MSQKKREIRYLKPTVTKTVSNVTKNVIRIPQTTKFPQNNFTSKPLANEITHLVKPKRNRVFIIGGGTSLTDFDFSLLKDEDIIAVNKSIESVPHATYFITMDYTFITDNNKLTNADFNIIKNKSETSYFVINTSHKYMQNNNGVYTDTRIGLRYDALEKFTGVIRSNSTYNITTGFGNNTDTFTHGQNSGYCALQLALLLGYAEIYLLGFDLQVHGAKTHYHSGYKQSPGRFSSGLTEYRANFAKSLQLSKVSDRVFSCSPSSYLNSFIKYKDVNLVLNSTPKEVLEYNEPIIENIKPPEIMNNELIIVGYYTVNTPYEKEAEGLLNSCRKLNLKFDIPGIPSFGSWQSNTRFKAKFMLDMLQKYPGQKLLYVDCDAIIHSEPVLFKNYEYDIGIRYQDFNWRKNECLSGTIFMRSNEKTISLCKRWIEINESEGPNAKTLEQWNLDKAIQEGVSNYGLSLNNIPPEYTFIFDSMKRMYPTIKPIIEHFQASRKFRNKV